MRSKLFYLLFAISLGFNIFFAVGYFTTQKRLHTADPLQRKIEAAAMRLSLSDSQRAKLAEIFEKSRRELSKLKTKQRETVRLFKSEFKKSDPDIEKLRKAMEEIETMRRNVREEMAREWRDFFASLSEKQRRKAMRMLRNRPALRKALMIPSKE